MLNAIMSLGGPAVGLTDDEYSTNLRRVNSIFRRGLLVFIFRWEHVWGSTQQVGTDGLAPHGFSAPARDGSQLLCGVVANEGLAWLPRRPIPVERGATAV